MFSRLSRLFIFDSQENPLCDIRLDYIKEMLKVIKSEIDSKDDE